MQNQTAPCAEPEPLICPHCKAPLGVQLRRVAIIGNVLKVYRPFIGQCFFCGGDVRLGPAGPAKT